MCKRRHNYLVAPSVGLPMVIDKNNIAYTCSTIL